MELSDKSVQQALPWLKPTKHGTLGKKKVHTDNSSFKNDLLEPVILSLPGFYLQKEKSEEEEEGKKKPDRQNADLDKRDKDAMFELDTWWRTTSVLRD